MAILHVPEDERWAILLKRHLASPIESGKIQLWDPRALDPGASRKKGIRSAIRRADVLVLLLSAAFVASEEVQEVILPALRSRGTRRRKKLVPVLVSSFAIEQLPDLRDLVLWPSGGRGVREHPEEEVEACLTEIARVVAAGAHGGRGSPASAPRRREERFGLLRRILLQLRTPWYRRQYFERVLSQNDRFNQDWTVHRGPFFAPLRAVLVGARVSGQSASDARRDALKAGGATSPRPIVEQLAHDIQHGNAKTWAVLGPPGAGKTTALRQLCLLLATDEPKRTEDVPEELRPLMPVLFFLREHQELLEPQPPRLPDLLVQAHDSPETPGEWFVYLLGRGSLLVMLDGLDEVGDTEERGRVASWIREEARAYPRSRFIITSRPDGYAEHHPIVGAREIEVLPFSDSQRAEFVRSWYEAYSRSAGPTWTGVDAVEASRALLHEIASQPELRLLSRSPLLLTLLVNVHANRGALPQKRGDIYEEICRICLGLWSTSGRAEWELTPATMRRTLEIVAARMTDERAVQIDTARLLEILGKELEGSDIGEAWAVENLQLRSGLFVMDPGTAHLPTRQRKWSFLHRTFQEYLTASRWRAMPEDAADLVSCVEDVRWHEVIRFYEGKRPSGASQRSCLTRWAIGSESRAHSPITLPSEALAPAWRGARRGEMAEALARLRRGGGAPRATWVGAGDGAETHEMARDDQLVHDDDVVS